MTEITEQARAKAREIMLADQPAYGSAHREESVARFVQQVSGAVKEYRDTGWFAPLAPFILEEPSDPVQEALAETYGAAAPEFVAAFHNALTKRGLEIRKTNGGAP